MTAAAPTETITFPTGLRVRYDADLPRICRISA
jgi:hypothetical protein